MGPSSRPLKGAQPPIFGQRLLWPNAWMGQDASWYGSRPRPRRRFVRWGPRFPQKKGTPTPPILAHVYCGQTAGWMKTPLDTEVDLGPGVPSYSRKGHNSPPLFGPCLLWRRSPISATAELLLEDTAHHLSVLFSERELTFTFAICYRPSVCRLSVCRLSSVVCNVRAPYSGIRYLGHPLTSTENFTEIVPGKPLRRGS